MIAKEEKKRLGFEDEQKTTYTNSQTPQHEEVKEIKIGDIINDKGDIL